MQPGRDRRAGGHPLRATAARLRRAAPHGGAPYRADPHRAWRATARRALRAGTAGLLAAGALAAAGAPPAGHPAIARTAVETHFPVNGGFALTGHGFGHGRGLSQYGAYGAALQGLSDEQILDFYYPGSAAVTSYGDPQLRVLITEDQGPDTVVVAGTSTVSMGVVDHATGWNTPLPGTIGGSVVAAWRSVAVGGGSYLLQGKWAGAWQGYPVAAPHTTTGELEFINFSNNMTGPIRLALPDGTQRDYRGTMFAAPNGAGLQAINKVDLQSYLRSVVPSEMPSSWSAAALQAQAVAARTYLAAVRPSGPNYDICDSTSCQVYSGSAAYDSAGNLVRTYEKPSTDGAVVGTYGEIRSYGGAPIFAQFSSSNGGWSVAGSSTQPYLVARPDPYDGYVPSSAHDWTAWVPADQLGAALGVGRVLQLQVTARDGNGDWGGRVLSMTVIGTTGTVSISGDRFRSAAGLRSTWWTAPPGSPPNPAFAGADLSAIPLQGTGSGQVEVHTLTQGSSYQQFSVHAASVFAAIPPAQQDDWRFLTASYAGSGGRDLFGIHLRNTGSGRVEVHVASAASGYTAFSLHAATPVPALPPGGVDVGINPYAGDGASDVYLLPWQHTGSGQVEVHVLAASTAYHSLLDEQATAIPTSGIAPGTWTFLPGDGAGSGDLVCVHYAGATGSGRTEVHVLSRTSGYQQWSEHDATALGLFPAGGPVVFRLGDWQHDGIADLFTVLTDRTGSGRTELHVLDGGSGYTTFDTHLATGLGAPTTGWAFGLS